VLHSVNTGNNTKIEFIVGDARELLTVRRVYMRRIPGTDRISPVRWPLWEPGKAPRNARAIREAAVSGNVPCDLPAIIAPDPLYGMTHDKWVRLSHERREAIRDNSKLSPQLIGKEGYRVEAVDKHGERRRFIVGKSAGWRPCHLEIKRHISSGGGPADREYASVRVLAKVR
jgi:hypothetical protein